MPISVDKTASLPILERHRSMIQIKTLYRRRTQGIWRIPEKHLAIEFDRVYLGEGDHPILFCAATPKTYLSFPWLIYWQTWDRKADLVFMTVPCLIADMTVYNEQIVGGKIMWIPSQQNFELWLNGWQPTIIERDSKTYILMKEADTESRQLWQMLLNEFINTWRLELKNKPDGLHFVLQQEHGKKGKS